MTTSSGESRQEWLGCRKGHSIGKIGQITIKMKLTAAKRGEMNKLCNEERKKWIKDYVERETAVARKRG
jgi:hypothetical protein